jgi:hypothetical protein
MAFVAGTEPITSGRSDAMNEGSTRMDENEPARPTFSELAPGTDADRLDEIGREGEREKWSLWDGLADERGPIPAFGPARTDENGRLLMSDEERVARRDAAIRALAVVREITDETDTDEVWAEVLRGLEGAP